MVGIRGRKRGCGIGQELTLSFVLCRMPSFCQPETITRAETEAWLRLPFSSLVSTQAPVGASLTAAMVYPRLHTPTLHTARTLGNHTPGCV